MKKIFIIISLVCSVAANAQVYQNDPAFGRSIERYEVRKALHIPTFCGVPNLTGDVVLNKAAIAFDSCNSLLYVYNPKDSSWAPATGSGTIIISGSGIDSVTYSSNQLCQWVDGVSTCYRLNKFFDSTSYNSDSSKYLFFNNGTVRDSIPTGKTVINLHGPLYWNAADTSINFKGDSLVSPLKYAGSVDSADYVGKTLIPKEYLEARIAAFVSGGITRAELQDTAAAISGRKQDVLTLTTTGTSGAATLTGSTLNIPQYSGGSTVIDSTTKTGVLKGDGSHITAAVSGTDIKTINGSSILGSGDLVISSGSTIDTTSLSNRINQKVDSVKLSNDSLYARVNGVWKFQFKSSAFNLWRTNDSDIYFNTGNVGIGDSSPPSLLTIEKNNISVNRDSSLLIRNSASAIANSPQNSPSIVLEGQGYDNTLGRNKSYKWVQTTKPTSANTPVNAYVWQYSLDNGTPFDYLTFSPSGFTFSGNVGITAAGFSASGGFTSSGVNQFSNRVHIGGTADQFYASLDLQGNYGFGLPKITTTQRNAWAAYASLSLYNTVSKNFEFYDGSNWLGFGNTIVVPTTITSTGTTGNQTINTINGSVNIAAAGTTVTVANNKVTSNSIVQVVLRTNDSTAWIKNCVPASGSFTINLGAAATSEISIGFTVIN